MQRQFRGDGRTVEPLGEKLIGANQSPGTIGNRDTDFRLVGDHASDRPVSRFRTILFDRCALWPQKKNDRAHCDCQCEECDDQGDVLHLPVQQSDRCQHGNADQQRADPDIRRLLARALVQ